MKIPFRALLLLFPLYSLGEFCAGKSSPTMVEFNQISIHILYSYCLDCWIFPLKRETSHLCSFHGLINKKEAFSQNMFPYPARWPFRVFFPASRLFATCSDFEWIVKSNHLFLFYFRNRAQLPRQPDPQWPLQTAPERRPQPPHRRQERRLQPQPQRPHREQG